MEPLTTEIILNKLAALYLPGGYANVVDKKYIQQLEIQDKTVKLILTISDRDDPSAVDQMLHSFFAEHFPGVTLSLLLTNQQRKAGLLSHIPNVIAVASGKGGVAKSTTTVYLSIALQQLGLKVGILDADIYGPSLPAMMGCVDKPSVNEDKKIIPLVSHHLQWMSIGCMVPAEKALVWRGPMVQSALVQLMKDVDWKGLDVLMIDLPPGTGDIHLTLAQQVSLSGVLIVSTPQEIALADARKAINMFHKVDVPILGMIETMADFMCPHCHHSTPIFDTAGAKKEAAAQHVPFLGSVPIDPQLRQGCDKGQPLTVFQAQSPGWIAYKNIADQLKSWLI